MQVKDFICGLLAGWAQVISGQPLDIVKIKYQSSVEKLKITNIIKEIYSKHGLKGFYMGSSSLFLGIGPIIATQFLVYQASKRFLLSLKKQKHAQSHQSYSQFTSKLSILDISIAGVIVGAVVALIYCPIQYTKIQRQLYPDLHKSSLSLFWNQIKTNGIKNLSRGMVITIAKQSIGTGFYYSSYQESLRALTSNQRQKAGLIDFLISGGVAGLSYWIVIYPFDVIKTKVQNHIPYMQAIKQFLKQGYRGFGTVTIRSVIVNGFNFMTYQQCRKIFDKFQSIKVY